HSFYWFALPAPQKGDRPAGGAAGLPVLKVRHGWEDLFTPAGRARLEELLPAYLQRRPGTRNAALKAAPIMEVPRPGRGDAPWRVLLARLEFESGVPETVVVPLAFVPEERFGELLEPAAACGLARVAGPKPGLLCDALADPAYDRAMLQSFLEGRSQ